MTSLLLSAFIYLASAAVAVPLSKRLGLGSVLGYLIAGVLIGPVFGLVGQETESIQHVAEFGVVMMLFLVGLELEPHKLWQLRWQLLGLGGLQVVLTIAAITGIAMLMGLSWTVGVAAGCVLSMSSTAIVLQTLGEKNLLASQGGQASFSVLLFQDIAVIPMLALLPLLALPELAGQATEAAHHADAVNLLAGLPAYEKAGITFGVIALIVVGGHFLAGPIFRYIAAARLREIFTVVSLALVIGIAVLMSLIGLSPALGTFLAGVVLANSEYRHELESNIEPFKGLLLGLFFITVGAGVDFELLAHQGWKILGITLCVIVAKGLILLLLGKVFRLKRLDQKLFALALAQAGEFGFVLLSLVESNGVMPSHIAKQLLLAVALSMLFTPLLFIVYDKVMVPRAYARAKAGDAVRPDVIEQKHPVIIAGHGRFGRVINAMVTACGYKTTVIDHNAATVAGYKRFGVETYFGDASRQELLLIAGLAEARLLVVAIDNHEQAMKITEFARKTNPGIKIVARSYDAQQTYELYHAGADEIVRENFDSAVRCGKRALECLGMPKLKAEEVGNLYFHRNRHGMAMAAKAYDPNIGMFENKALIEIVRAEMAETERLIRQLLHDQAISWPKDQAETTTEHGDMNMQEPVEGG
ncbi:monovalent cation:proton antiporter-2 (CPA2) family protein [Lautropia mirabilis]|uniref:monovalent cation:proton antiporter-2 (CPA2) family protein n=1 Tax=Lautropia mirabilis TaxID=47671 RepID=UPI00288B67F9|nr:monovalent cation:proton antiporter-2 (CPA2) family protein [Lautropia mirabilis]